MTTIRFNGRAHVIGISPADEAALLALLADLEANGRHQSITVEPEGVPNRSKTDLGVSAAAQASGPSSVVAETIGAIFGMAGAFLLAMPMLPGWGFGAFLVSNVCWLIFSSRNRHWRLFAQQCVFLVSSLVGLWNWWLGPLLLG